MVLRGRLDLRCVRMSKSFQVIDSHNALIHVISTTAELAAYVSTSGLTAFRLSFDSASEAHSLAPTVLG